MTEEEIAAIVRGAMLSDPRDGTFTERLNERTLISTEAARQILALVQPAIDAAVAAERERCAGVAGEVALRQPNSMFYTAKEEGMASAAQFIAAAIRSRSQESETGSGS